MKCVLRAWGQLKRWFEVLALGEICFYGTGAVQKWFELFVPGEMCFEGMGAVEEGFEVLALGEAGPAAPRPSSAQTS